MFIRKMRARLSLSLVAVGLTWAFFFESADASGLVASLNYAARVIGIGWSDGYHASRSSANLRPHGDSPGHAYGFYIPGMSEAISPKAGPYEGEIRGTSVPLGVPAQATATRRPVSVIPRRR